MKTTKVTLTKVKVTKNTVRYDHPAGEGICPSVYLKKVLLPKPHPNRVEVTIGFPED